MEFVGVKVYRRNVTWSDLPENVLGIIAKYMFPASPSWEDVRRFPSGEEMWPVFGGQIRDIKLISKEMNGAVNAVLAANPLRAVFGLTKQRADIRVVGVSIGLPVELLDALDIGQTEFMELDEMYCLLDIRRMVMFLPPGMYSEKPPYLPVSELAPIGDDYLFGRALELFPELSLQKENVVWFPLVDKGMWVKFVNGGVQDGFTYQATENIARYDPKRGGELVRMFNGEGKKDEYGVTLWEILMP